MITLRPYNNKREFPSVFGKYFNDLLENDPLRGEMNNISPAVNIAETDDAFRMEVAAPGMEKQDFAINLDKNLLTLEAKKQEQKEETTEKYNRREFNFSSFKRTFSLPESVDQENISAKYENGILYLTLPKRTEDKNGSAKKIDVV